MNVMTTENTGIVVPKLELKTFPILTPSASYRGAPAMTIMCLVQAARILKREVIYIEGTYKGYAFAITQLFSNASKILGTDKVRGMIVEDDIYFNNPDKLAEAIKKADENGWNLIAPYRVPDRDNEGNLSWLWTISDGEGAYTDSEIKKLKDYDEVQNGGLGFYYGDIPLDYKFREEGKYKGHDLNFYHDNQIKLRYVDLGIRHIKTVML